MADKHSKTSLFVDKQPGGAFRVVDQAITTGAVFFVDDATGTDAEGNGYTWLSPFASLDYAITQCTDDAGDVIYCMPNHAESTSTGGTELFDLDVDGVSVIGLGVGDARPTFTLEEATCTVVLGKPSCRLSNVRIVGNITDLATGIEIEAAAVGCRIDHCYIGDSGAALDMLVAVAIEANADRLIFEDNHVNITVGGEATAALNFAGGCDHLIIRNNVIIGDWVTDAAIEASTAASLGISITDNLISNHSDTTGLCFNCNAGTTGGLYRNIVCGDVAATETVATVTAMHCGENYGMDMPAKSGILTPSTMTAWA